MIIPTEIQHSIVLCNRDNKTNNQIKFAYSEITHTKE